MTLHDYKLVCASYTMVADGAICELCAGDRYYNCFLKKCVKDSRAKSLLNTIEMYLHHNLLKIYDLVDVFISPSVFLQSKLADTRFGKKIIHIPNFIKAEDYIPSYDWTERSIVYFGRLSREKGVSLLLNAMKDVPAIKLKIVGDGPLRESLQSECAKKGMSNIVFLGQMSGQAMKAEISASMFVVVPSEWYENNPRVVIESFALGKPVVGSRIGGIPELVIENTTGLTFKAFDSGDLREKIKYLSENPDQIRAMGKNARSLVEKEYGADDHYSRLMETYDIAIHGKSVRRAG